MKQQIIDILTDWLNYADKHARDKINDFWLVRDYAYEDMGDRFYKKHKEEAIKILDSLDRSKEQVKMVYDYMQEVLKKYV